MNVLQKTMVIGAGQMGCGIAQTLIQSGGEVTLYDIKHAAVNRGMSLIEESLKRLVDKEKLTKEQREQFLAKLTPTISLKNAESVDLVIEAAPEQMEIKKSLFKKLDRICKADTILATNTSSLSITDIASATSRPGLVIGMHFMNPVPVMPLVEIISGLATTEETRVKVKKLTQALGKTPVEAKDFPGFIANRILMPMINEAIYAIYEGVAEPEAIDQIMKLGMNHPMGPLALADFIGLDTCLAIMETLQQGFGDSKYRPCPLLRQYVQAGWLGRKSGRGFYLYS
ncbi:3-hydroxybutyryl-CoA dehydrogenase [Paenibacillus sp. FSL H8-0548]|uniref:3-hydroxybutyryl-CoA dehydrogenase n=1 Tax=Paenibacillus sp. FSL H8-0548 TaxID=1920422 RepID=UPI00096E0A5E|nr:3-hydroxybutyryl-CoA dehydrogenase [Paenibacillus sp. FSL H8-0548]OMF38413.1 3-hydroxybutyryl-CoA dehydrogenase [Paenibacillus sp. FSL H8-0548]